MLLRPRHLLLLALAAPVFAGPKPEEIESYRLGLDALSGNLWGVAANRFENALATPELDPAARETILLRLAEARVRGHQPALALTLLADPALKDHPARPFWTAQALAAEGRFGEAIQLLAKDALAPSAPFRNEALLTKATLERALGDSDAALATLGDPELRNLPDAALLKGRILSEQGQAEEALKVLPDPAKLPAPTAAMARFQRAEAHLASGQPAEAAELFALLAADPTDQPLARHQSLRQHHAAHLGLARARIAMDETAAAADGLIAFLRGNPDTPLIASAFDLLLQCLPEKPAPSDPILTRLAEWVPEPPLGRPLLVSRPLILESPGSSADAWPRGAAPANRLAPNAMFHLALGLRRQGSPESLLTARLLLGRLRLEYPTHRLVARALLTAGRWNLEDGQRDQAMAALDALDLRGELMDRLDDPSLRQALRGAADPPARLGEPPSATLRAHALLLEANALFDEGHFLAAGTHFARAAALLEDGQRRAARLNAATSLLAGGALAGFDQVAGDVDDPELETSLALERGLYLASIHDPAALGILRSFIAAHPAHPRLAEARLSAALAALDAVPPEVGYATTQLHTLATLDETERSALPAAALALAEIRLHDRRQEWAEAAARAASYLEQHPDSTRQPAFRWEQGKALFQNKDYNASLLILKKLAGDFPDSPQAPASLLLAARAAAEGATPQSQKESFLLFDRLIESKSPFADVARIEKARMLIDLRRHQSLDEAIALLGPWFESMKDDDPLFLTVGLLLGEALNGRAEDSSELLTRALATCDRLLEALPEDATERATALLQKGRTLDLLGRRDEALIAYMDVIQGAASGSRVDWKAVEDCGNRALTILEERQEWRAAKSLALRIAALGGPGASEAAEHAKWIGLKYMIYDDPTGETEEEPGPEAP